MADNVHRKSHKLSDGSSRKTSNPVHRTTTETIRLGEPEKLYQPVSLTSSSNVTASNQCRKKTSSFQITSVTVGCRMSNDAGEDSNDDLDESHTEDNSVEHSRITDIDIETPSYSEDTFSKEDVFFNTSNAALSTAPVIPTSSQYGLAIVPSEGNNVINSVNDSNINTLDITSVTDNNIINLLSSNVKQDADLREVHSHGRNERFKVVKIESTEPFKRGRWTCMDYLDHTSVNQPTAISTPKVSDPNEVCISYGVTDSGIVIPDASKQSVVSEDKGIGIDTNGQVSAHPDVHSSIGVPSNTATVSSANYAVGNSIPPNAQHNPTQVQTQQKVQAPSQIPPYFQSSTQQLTSQPQQQGTQGSTLPSNLQPAHPNNLTQPQSMPQGSIPIITQTGNSNVTAQQSIPHSKEDTYVTVSTQNQSLPVQTVCQPSVQQPPVPTSQAPNILVTQQQQHAPPSQQQQQQHPPTQPQQQSQQQQQQQPQQSLQTQKPITQISEPLTAIQGMQGIQNIHKVPQTGAQQTSSTIHAPGAPVQSQVIPPSQMQPQTSGSNAQVQMAQVSASCQNVVGGMQQGNMTFHQSDPEQDSISGIVAASTTQSADTALLESLTEVTQGSDEHHTLEDNESMSGTSAVAIDNKIEQAMDLVKSHLMFAVREEVEVLKEKIAELMDRINQLEAENSILKAHATPETLAQLSQSAAKLPQNSSGSGQ
ncbi:PREDICTED: protein bunched, class 2/F/G isoform-like [Dufourea novaeangliae]|uniref:Protein bunched, class 2/F/G isoform n=1 Tax=Dufourea novaeangliae TaxID=178035 RepID=A0A154PRC9_DUFNO|nr:PREDICTED: protein bunched, class 2/F/G isoform-like [Dufourea novaeangliae]KZC14459.1 Protein bunched, class 2/F/G isoform [Dufourea novaeangliae]